MDAKKLIVSAVPTAAGFLIALAVWETLHSVWHKMIFPVFRLFNRIIDWSGSFNPKGVEFDVCGCFGALILGVLALGTAVALLKFTVGKE